MYISFIIVFDRIYLEECILQLMNMTPLFSPSWTCNWTDEPERPCNNRNSTTQATLILDIVTSSCITFLHFALQSLWFTSAVNVYNEIPPKHVDNDVNSNCKEGSECGWKVIVGPSSVSQLILLCVDRSLLFALKEILYCLLFTFPGSRHTNLIKEYNVWPLDLW